MASTGRSFLADPFRKTISDRDTGSYVVSQGLRADTVETRRMSLRKVYTTPARAATVMQVVRALQIRQNCIRQPRLDCTNDMWSAKFKHGDKQSISVSDGPFGKFTGGAGARQPSVTPKGIANHHSMTTVNISSTKVHIDEALVRELYRRSHHRARKYLHLIQSLGLIL